MQLNKLAMDLCNDFLDAATNADVGALRECLSEDKTLINVVDADGYSALVRENTFFSKVKIDGYLCRV